LTAAVLGVGVILPLAAITYGWLVHYGYAVLELFCGAVLMRLVLVVSLPLL
jgi:hypothetical protein